MSIDYAYLIGGLQGFSAMDHFRNKGIILPIEILIVLAINVVVAAFGYYAFTIWSGIGN